MWNFSLGVLSIVQLSQSFADPAPTCLNSAAAIKFIIIHLNKNKKADEVDEIINILSLHRFLFN